MAAPAAPSAAQSTPQPMRFAGEGSQSSSSVDATEELCHGVGRAGPYCLYRCSNGQWIYSRQYPTGPCPPFHLEGHRDLSLGRVAKCQVSANMKKIRITAPAATFVNEKAKWAETQIGPGFVPVIDWVMGDSEYPNFIPQLGLAFEKPDVVDRSRIMECEGKDVEIFQYVPDELLEEDGPEYVDVRNNRLVLARESSRARDEKEGAARAREDEAGGTGKASDP